MGMPIAEIEKIALQTDWKLMAKILSPTLSTSFFVKDKYLLEFLDTYFNGKTFDSLQIPFSCISTDIETGEMVVIRKGYLATAIRASISIPMIFSPVIYGLHKLIDGGLVNPTPVDVVKSQNVDKIIAVNLMNFAHIKPNLNKNIEQESKVNSSLNKKLGHFIKHPINYFNDKTSPKDEGIPHFGKILYRILFIVQVQMSNLTLRIAKPDILIEPDTTAYNLFDFQKGKELIEIGYKCAMEELNKNAALLK